MEISKSEYMEATRKIFVNHFEGKDHPRFTPDQALKFSELMREGYEQETAPEVLATTLINELESVSEDKSA